MSYDSVISPDRLLYLEKQAREILALKKSGAVVEIGIYKGGSLARIANILHNKVVYGIDTFIGMPEPSIHDTHKKGDFKDVDYEKMKTWFSINCPNVRLIKGFFPQVADQLLHSMFCFVHIDVDLYQSVKDCCEYFYPKLITGGVMIFDDWGFESTRGAKLAIKEYFEDIKTCIKRPVIVNRLNGTGQSSYPTGQYFVYKFQL